MTMRTFCVMCHVVFTFQKFLLPEIALMMKAVSSYETSVNFYEIASQKIIILWTFLLSGFRIRHLLLQVENRWNFCLMMKLIPDCRKRCHYRMLDHAAITLIFIYLSCF